MKRLIKRPGIIALMALMVIMAACEYGMVEKPSPYYHSGQPISGEPDGTYTVTFDKNGGDTEASPGTMSVISPATTVDALPTPPARTDYFFDGWNTAANGSGTEFTASTSVTKSITVYAQWTNTPNSNANIRAVSGDGANALYGLYVGGMPGISNGTPQADAEGFTDITITLSGNNPTADPSRSVVVIVEDKKVSKVEFGINSGNAETTLNDNSAPSTWHVLAKNDEYTTPDTVGKRWTGPLTVAAPTSSSVRGVYVRITAQDGTVQVYRYVQYISVTVTNKVTRGELSALSIGGVDVIKGGDLQGSNSKGIASGWWNRTVAPDFEPGLVTIPSAQAASCAVSATVNNSASGVNISIAKISASEWPLLESSSVTFGAASSNTTGTGTFNVQNGDYIVIRQNASPSDANYKALFSHTIIKVNFEVPTVTFNKNGGDTEASPATKPVTPPATTVGTLPTPPTRTGYSFTGWDTVAGGSGSAFTATTTVTESATVYAQWSAYTLSISYANGGGTGSAPASPASAAYGTNVTMPANTYTNEAKNFAGWAVSGTGSKLGTHAAGAIVAVSALSTAIETGNASITLTATWSDAPIVKSSNANIRAVSGSGAATLYGLYIAGSPGTSNGTPQSTTSGFTTHTSTIWGNYTLSDPANNRSIVVIVEDNKVSKVEFGITTNATAAPTSVTVPSSWANLTKNNEYTTVDTADKRWTGTLTEPARPSATNYRQVYVRITAEDGTTVQVYRYVQYVSGTTPSGSNAARGELNSLTIGTVSVVASAKDAGTSKAGTYAGWWNKTVAPEIEPGVVTLTATQASNVSISATFFMSSDTAGSTISYAKVSEWPLKESAVTFTNLTTTTSSNVVVTSQSIGSVSNGDYIILRRDPGTTTTTYPGLYGHYVIKVTVN